MTSQRLIDSFDFAPGRKLAGKYVISRRLGGGYEGEVYEVIETRTGVRRAAKFFYPHRNKRDRAVTRYARKLDKLRDCRIVIQYHHSETIRHRATDITCLISEYVGGQLLSRFLARQPQHRIHPFEALHLLYELVCGLDEVHAMGEYHGDLHDDNVMITRRGAFFDVKLVDFYHLGPPRAQHYRDDVVDVVRLFYDAVGGQARYSSQPPYVKAICRGLRRDLIQKAFPTASHLREHLESFPW